MTPFHDVDGNNKELSQGKSLLYFYPKDDTPGCTLEAKEFSDLLDDFSAICIEIFGVSKDDAKSHRAFTEKCDLKVPLLTADEETLAQFGVWVEKNLYGRKSMGIERSTFLLEDGKVVKEWRRVKPEGHAQAVLRSVRSLGSASGQP